MFDLHKFMPHFLFFYQSLIIIFHLLIFWYEVILVFMVLFPIRYGGTCSLFMLVTKKTKVFCKKKKKKRLTFLMRYD